MNLFLISFQSILFLFCACSLQAKADGPLIVVHASRTFDPLASARNGIEQALAKWKSSTEKIYFLRHSDSVIFNGPYAYSDGIWILGSRKFPGKIYDFSKIDSYYISPSSEFQTIFSQEGEHKLQIGPESVTVVGGYLEGCLANAIAHAYASSKQPSMQFNIFMPGTYSLSYPPLPEFVRNSVQWIYPVNPGFRYLERQVYRLEECPSYEEIAGALYDNDRNAIGDVINDGQKTHHSQHHLIVKCDGKVLGQDKNKNGLPHLILNFISRLD